MEQSSLVPLLSLEVVDFLLGTPMGRDLDLSFVTTHSRHWIARGISLKHHGV